MTYLEIALEYFTDFEQSVIRRYMDAVYAFGLSREGFNFSTLDKSYNTLLRLFTTMRAAYQAYIGRIQPLPPLQTSSTTTTPRSTVRKQDCLDRDNHRCIITDRNGWPEVAHIVPFLQCNDERKRQGEFWKFIEMFLGEAETNRVWGLVGGSNVNDTRNLITLDSALHAMFDNFRLLIKQWSMPGHDFLHSEWVERSYGLQLFFVTHPRPNEYSTGKAHFHTLPLFSDGPFSSDGTYVPKIIAHNDTFKHIQQGTTIMVYPHQRLALNMPHPTLLLIRYIFSTIARLFRAAGERDDPASGYWNGDDAVGSENDVLGNMSYLLNCLTEVEKAQQEQKEQQKQQEQEQQE